MIDKWIQEKHSYPRTIAHADEEYGNYDYVPKQIHAKDTCTGIKVPDNLRRSDLTGYLTLRQVVLRELQVLT